MIARRAFCARLIRRYVFKDNTRNGLWVVQTRSVVDGFTYEIMLFPTHALALQYAVSNA